MTRLHRPAKHPGGGRKAVGVVEPTDWRRKPVRAGILALAIVLAACSSDTAPVSPSDPTASAALLKKDCADPQWKEENLGLWYSVCRQSLRW
jgi:hypothetical protein